MSEQLLVGVVNNGIYENAVLYIPKIRYETYPEGLLLSWRKVSNRMILSFFRSEVDLFSNMFDSYNEIREKFGKIPLLSIDND